MTNMARRTILARVILPMILAIVPILLQSTAHGARLNIFDTAEDRRAVLAGYGQSFPGWGDTSERVKTVDIIGRYSHLVVDDVGSGWYEGFHSLFLEVPISVVVSPELSSMVGINFLAAYTFTAGSRWQPYLFVGGGPVYSFADIPGMGAEFNGNYQFGIGFRCDWNSENQVLAELRYHHISNGGSEEPNDPLNSLKVLLGISF